MHLSHTAPGEGTANAPRRVPSLIKVKLAEEGAVSLALSSCVFSRESRSARKLCRSFSECCVWWVFSGRSRRYVLLGAGIFRGARNEAICFLREFSPTLWKRTGAERVYLNSFCISFVRRIRSPTNDEISDLSDRWSIGWFVCWLDSPYRKLLFGIVYWNFDYELVCEHW